MTGEIPVDQIVDLLLQPATLMTQGLVGLIVGLGSLALQFWLTFEIIVNVPPRVKRLIDSIDFEFGQLSYWSGMKYRFFFGILQVCLPLLLVAASYIGICYFLQVLTQFFGPQIFAYAP